MTMTATMSDGAMRARRATGAIFFAVFGGAWLEGWAFDSARPMAVALGIGVLALALAWAALATYRRHAAALAAHPVTPAGWRAKKVFHIVNATQWIIIFILTNLLIRNGLGTWVIPMVILVIGVHFLPLGRVFVSRPHYVTGAALIAFAIAYPLMAPAGPVDSVGCSASD
jgi:hypothetical protein